MKLTEEQIKRANDAWTSLPLIGNMGERVTAIIEAIAPHVQYATTGQGVPLSDREMLMVRKDYGVFLSSNAYTAINAVLAKRNVAQPAPAGLRVEDYRSGYSCGWYDHMNGLEMRDAGAAAIYFAYPQPVADPQQVEVPLHGILPDAQPVDGDMVDQMLVCLYGPKCGGWDWKLRRNMAEAARVPLDAIRGPVTPEESKEYLKDSKKPLEWIPVLIDRRIKRILKPKKKTARDEVVDVLSSFGPSAYSSNGKLNTDLVEAIIAMIGKEPRDD